MGIKKTLLSTWVHLQRAEALDFRPKANGLIVCFTSLPQRFHLLRYPIFSLLKQSLKPDYIEINLGYVKDGSEPTLPKWITQLSAVRIHYVTDIGSMTKYVPSIERHHISNPLLVIVDDDVYYYKDFLKNLVNAQRTLPEPAVVCYQGQAIRRDSGWASAMDDYPRDNQLHRCGLVTGFRGYCLRPQYLDQAALRSYASLSPLARKMDDIWISGHLSRQNIPKYTLSLKKAMSKTMSFHSMITDDVSERIRYNNEVIDYFRADWRSEEFWLGLPGDRRTS